MSAGHQLFWCRDLRGAQIRLGSRRRLTLGGLGALFVLSCAVAACSYFMPSVDIVIAPKDPGELGRLRDVLESFAKDYSLQRGRPGESGAKNDPPSLANQKKRTVYYLTGNSSGRGFDFSVYEATPRCVVVRFSERSREWTAKSRSGLRDLQRRLTTSLGSSVRSMGTPGDKRNRRPIEDHCRAIGSEP
jgi:hypothetical protein